MSMESLSDLLEDELKDLFNAENQLVKALPKMAKKATTDSLKQAFNKHLKETEQQIQRLEQVASELDISLKGKKCHAMEGLIAEGKDVLEEDGEPDIIDAALIGAAQRIEHYEMAGYGVAKALAQQLGHDDVVKLLQETLDEEGAADKALTEIAENEVYTNANKNEDDESDDSESDDDDEESEDESDEEESDDKESDSGEEDEEEADEPPARSASGRNRRRS